MAKAEAAGQLSLESDRMCSESASTFKKLFRHYAKQLPKQGK